MGKYVKEMEDQKMHEEMNAKFDTHMKEYYGEGYASTLGEEACGKLKESFIAKQGEPFGDNSHAAPNVNESEDQPFEDNSDPSKEQGHSIAEMHKVDPPHGVGSDPDKGQDTSPAGINEEEKEHEEEKHDDDREEEEKVDEIHGQSYSAGKVRAGTLPNQGQGYRNRPGHERTRAEWGKANENYKKRVTSLIEENKKLTKEINVARKSFGKAENLVETYKNHLEKYRTQLKEMAIFNTNLANVNNLLVNEELALTADDKVNIINKFKLVNSLEESDNVYGQILTEMKEGKKTLSENVEEKMNTTVGESSKQKIDEAIERTAYQNNEHINKIKNLMNYVDKK